MDLCRAVAVCLGLGKKQLGLLCFFVNIVCFSVYCLFNYMHIFLILFPVLLHFQLLQQVNVPVCAINKANLNPNLNLNLFLGQENYLVRFR